MEVEVAEVWDAEDKDPVKVVVDFAPPDQLVLLLPELGFPAEGAPADPLPPLVMPLLPEPPEELLFQTVPPRIPRTMAKTRTRTI